MAIKKFKPTSPALRQMTVLVSDEITTNQPEKSLLVSLKKNSGRNAHGKITVRHRGGGNRRKYRRYKKCINKSKIYEGNNERKKFHSDGIYHIKMICFIKWTQKK